MKVRPARMDGATLYVSADIATLRAVKGFVPELTARVSEFLRRQVTIHAQVAKPGEQATPFPGTFWDRGLDGSGGRRRPVLSRQGQGEQVGAVTEGQLQVVGGHDDGPSLGAQLVDESHQLAGVVPVLPVSGLVQDDDVAFLADHGGHGEPAGLTSREGQGVVVPMGNEVELLKEPVNPRL